MCDLVYLVAAESAAPALLEATARAHRMHCDSADDRAISRALDGERLYSTFAKCSCGTELGARPVEVGPPWTERDVRDLARKGWGEAKIARWKAQREAAIKPAPVRSGPSAEAVEMAACLRALLAAGVPRVGFVVHAAGNRVVRAQVKPAALLDAEVVQAVPFDTVQVFGR